MPHEEYELIDRDQYFAAAVSKIMGDMGIDYDKYSIEEMHQFFADAVSVEQECWDELMLWVACGDDKRERTKILLRAQMMKGRRYR